MKKILVEMINRLVVELDNQELCGTYIMVNKIPKCLTIAHIDTVIVVYIVPSLDSSSSSV